MFKHPAVTSVIAFSHAEIIFLINFGTSFCIAVANLIKLYNFISANRLSFITSHCIPTTAIFFASCFASRKTVRVYIDTVNNSSVTFFRTFYDAVTAFMKNFFTGYSIKSETIFPAPRLSSGMRSLSISISSPVVSRLWYIRLSTYTVFPVLRTYTTDVG